MNSVRFFVNKRTNNELLFANGKRIKQMPGLQISVWCLHVSMSPCLYFFMSPGLHVSMSLCFHVSISMSSCPCLHVSGIPQTKNGSNGKQPLPFVFCKWKTEIANFRIFAANGNGKWMFVFLGQQKINDNRFEQTCPSVHVPNSVNDITDSMISLTLRRLRLNEKPCTNNTSGSMSPRKELSLWQHKFKNKNLATVVRTQLTKKTPQAHTANRWMERLKRFFHTLAVGILVAKSLEQGDWLIACYISPAVVQYLLPEAVQQPSMKSGHSIWNCGSSGRNRKSYDCPYRLDAGCLPESPLETTEARGHQLGFDGSAYIGRVEPSPLFYWSE